MLGSGYGSVGREVAYLRSLVRFQSLYLKLYIKIVLQKRKNKEKEAENASL